MNAHSDKWTDDYGAMISRNIGFISEQQQQRLRTAKVAILGVGGLGGTAMEVLLRSGIGRFSIVDRDVFDASNMNRQVFADRTTLGRRKIDVAAEWAAKVNPDVKLEKFDHVDEKNIADILAGADAAVMAIDSLVPCIIASRACHEMDIPLVEGWAIPYANVRVYTAETPSLEEVYRLPTQGRAVAEIPEDELKQLGLLVFEQLGQIEGLHDYYSEEVIQKIQQGHIVSFAGPVWFTAVLMALETVKILLGWGKPSFAPTLSLYDPFSHQVPAQPE